MLGQTVLIDTIYKQIEAGIFPHCCILAGAKGSGKKTLINDVIVPKLGGIVYPVECSIANIRDMIKQAYTIKNPVIYVLADMDKLSAQGKQALLKVTEEPPNNAYIIMTIENVYNTLPTIRSRAVVYNMQNYTSNHIASYFKDLGGEEQDLDIVLDLCENLGEVNILKEAGIQPFYEYIELVVDNVSEVTGSNAFKVGDKLSLKQDAKGYDLKLFLKGFMSVCLKRMEQNPIRYSMGISVTSNALRRLGVNGVSKQMVLDNWILQIRKFWD